jgi:hypothetical protein
VTTKDSGLKRYNLVLPEKLFEDLQQLSDRRHTTVVELLRKFIKLGLAITAQLEDNPDAALIIRVGETERELMLFL